MSKEIRVPDIGGASDVDVIAVLIKPGDSIAVDTPLVTLEGDKASMDVPATEAGIVESVAMKEGDKASEGSVICVMKAADGAAVETPQPAAVEKQPATQTLPSALAESNASVENAVHASPAVRRLARELSIDLARVKGTGEKNRITKTDLKHHLSQGSTGGGFSLPAMPAVDFSKFGVVESQPLSKIKKISGANLHRNWMSIPHITQFIDADITELEAFRKSKKDQLAKEGVKLTPLVFIMKAVVAALQKFPQFNASLDASGEHLIVKKYFHIGVAVDTPNGLVVPVIRDVDQKGMAELAAELGVVSKKARDGKLGMADMQGGCFSISSLGGIGGTAFTPIVNAPEVAILGVSKSSMKPVFQQNVKSQKRCWFARRMQKNNSEFASRLMLPLSLSYDHRVIDGADGARFAVYLTECLSDIRALLL